MQIELTFIKSTAYDFDFLRVLISCHIERPLWA